MFSKLCYAILLTVSCNGLMPMTSAAAETPAVAFSGERAFSLLEQQVEMGPRVPGSAGNRRLHDLILSMARELGFSATSSCLTVKDPLGADEIEICNVVVTIAAAGSPVADRLWLGAHFDTRPIADHDPDPTRRGRPVPGANDGASGTAILLHLMELMHQQAPPTEVNLLFFDGEDSGPAGDAGGFCLGSKHLAASWQDFGSPLAGSVPRGLILLDMVGEKGVQIPMEGYSLQYAPQWTRQVFERAATLGLSALVAAPGRPIYDDHVPFLGAGIPAVDLIDFEYPQWHTTADLPAACSAASLSEVGTLVWDLIQNP
ncbi:MAG: M28 family peptidase [Candidatus Krumholzibacteria bacterium]|nr:M28 family peptidase [Candidatus Krumholzibacteria bacterium]